MTHHRNLPLLVPTKMAGPDVHVWATVTQASPLRIRLDGETDPLPFTPTTLVGSLALNNRVLVLLISNADPNSRSRRVVIIGKPQ